MAVASHCLALAVTLVRRFGPEDNLESFYCHISFLRRNARSRVVANRKFDSVRSLATQTFPR